jgi:hypothetical protein
MSFKTLLERYETNVQDLYSPPSYTGQQTPNTLYENIKEQYDATQDWLYDTKKVRFDPDDVDYNWTKLKKGSVGTNTTLLKAQQRSLPIIAALDDAKRLAKFQVSGKGLLFLAQQALLQTGNTFASTRVINPLFAVGNSVPFLHLNRSLVPISIGGIKLDLSKSKELTGKLQQETIENLSPFLGNLVGKGSSKNSALRMTQGLFSGGLSGIAKKLTSPFKSVKNAISLGRSGSNEFGLMNLYKTSDFPLELIPGDGNGRYIGKNQVLESLYNYPVKRAVGLIDSTGNDNMFYGGGIRTVVKPEVEGTETPEYEDEILGATGTQDRLNYLEVVNNQPIPYISRRPTTRRGQVGISSNNTKLPNRKLEDLYTALSRNRNEDDYIITRIRVGKFNMQFRSFIKDIKENVNSEMNERNYIGRTERFISYAGAKREVSFTLQLIAMHQDELMATHTRINYLIGSLFPMDAIQGLLQPPITFLTIGDLFSNQPGYFKSLSIDYPYSWEVRDSGADAANLQLPMGANISANYVILEKGTVFHQSPFHGVMEKF